MSHIPFPFQTRGFLLFKNSNPDEIEQLSTEVAESHMEVFQALNYRDYSEFEESLLLNFRDPAQQNFVLLDFNFSLRVLTIGLDGIVNNVFDLEKKSSKGYYIKSFTGLKMVLLTKPTSSIYHPFNIRKNHTKVDFLADIKDWYKYIKPRWIKEFKTKSDLELIESLNNRVGMHNEGFARGFYFTMLMEEIHFREFESDIIFIDKKGNFRRRIEKRIILKNNRLEFVKDDEQ